MMHYWLRATPLWLLLISPCTEALPPWTTPKPPHSIDVHRNQYIKEREGRCYEDKYEYVTGDIWNRSGACEDHECKEDGSIVVNRCPPVPEKIPEGWELKADDDWSFYPFCCKKAVPRPDPKEPQCFANNRTVTVGEQVDIPGRCYRHVCTGANQWSVDRCESLKLYPRLWEVLPGDPTKPYPDCCGKAVPILDIVPDVLDYLNTSAKMVGLRFRDYSFAHVWFGNELRPAQLREPPYEENSPSFFEWNLLMMIDADVSDRKSPNPWEFLHWMVGNFKGQNISSGEAIAEYVRPVPSKGSGLHRYIFFLYEQPGKLDFEEDRLNNTTVGWRKNFSFKKFAEKYKLGNPKGFNVFRAQWDETVPETLKQLGIEDMLESFVESTTIAE